MIHARWRALVVACVLAAATAAGSAGRQAVTFDRIFPLKPDEGVFAYARISPDGRHLAYASQKLSSTGRVLSQTETVVDVRTQQVVFSEPGIDGYFSNDNSRLIFLSFAGGRSDVAIRHQATGTVTHGVAPVSLGDYFSWSVRDGKDLILTIQSNYYELDGNDRAVLPAGRVTSCPDIGVGSRPLISKDGRRITTFVRGHVVVRALTECNDILDTGLQGAKADFSFDGRYVAFHVAKAGGAGSEIVIVDTAERTVRTLAGLPGDSLFPSWTKDGRLCFRYDGADYRGFMFASNVLSLPARPLGPPSAELPDRLAWAELFPGTAPPHRTTIVMIWSDWSPHAPTALTDLQRLAADAAARRLDLGVLTAVPEGVRRADIDRILRMNRIDLPELPLRADRVHLTGALNQIPTELLFRDGVLIEQRLGPLSYADLAAWLAQHGLDQDRPAKAP